MITSKWFNTATRILLIYTLKTTHSPGIYAPQWFGLVKSATDAVLPHVCEAVLGRSGSKRRAMVK